MARNIDAAAVADMESELQQLRQQNKELRSRVEILTNCQQQQQQQQQQAGAGHKKTLSTKNISDDPNDDSYKLYSTPNHTPTRSIEYCESSKVPQSYEVEMGNMEGPKVLLKQKIKKHRDGGGDYASASTGGDEEEQQQQQQQQQHPNIVHNDDYEGSGDDAFIDDDSHNKHRTRKRRNKHHGIISSSSGIAATNRTFPPFSEAIRERAGWLIGLLFFQSCSSFIIAYNEQFLQTHMVIVQFLTMLVGAGGNAGNQSAVGVIRGLAIGTINGNTWKAYLMQEAKMAAGLSFLIGLTGFIRAAMFRTPWGETIAITTSVSMIVVTSVAIGSTLPLAMKKVGIDPAHSSTTIQVIMDILGVLITVMVSSFVMSFAVFQGEDDGSVDDTTYKMDTAEVGG